MSGRPVVKLYSLVSKALGGVAGGGGGWGGGGGGGGRVVTGGGELLPPPPLAQAETMSGADSAQIRTVRSADCGCRPDMSKRASVGPALASRQTVSVRL